MTDYIKAWQCIGCGRLEAPQPCVGICQDRKVRLVDALEHESVLAQLAQATSHARELETLVRQLATIVPHADAWESSYRMLQERARRLLRESLNRAPVPETSS